MFTLVEYKRFYFAGEEFSRDRIVMWTTKISQEQEKKITNLKKKSDNNQQLPKTKKSHNFYCPKCGVLL